MGGHKKTRREQKPTNTIKRAGYFGRLLPVDCYRLEQIEHLYAYIHT